MILASREPRRHWPHRLTLALALGLLGAPAFTQAATPVPDPGAPLPYVIGLHEAYLTADYWAARLDNADAPILDRAQIEAQNARMRSQDKHIQDIATLPAQLSAAQVRD
ncbi:NlpC-P60 family protein, partial [Stenotrophomonas sp. 2YAF22]